MQKLLSPSKMTVFHMRNVSLASAQKDVKKTKTKRKKKKERKKRR